LISASVKRSPKAGMSLSLRPVAMVCLIMASGAARRKPGLLIAAGMTRNERSRDRVTPVPAPSPLPSSPWHLAQFARYRTWPRCTSPATGVGSKVMPGWSYQLRM
jgi:hypothetical protein